MLWVLKEPIHVEVVLLSTQNKCSDRWIRKYSQFQAWERSGSVVECLTWNRGGAGSSLTGVTVLSPWARDVKNQIKQTISSSNIFCLSVYSDAIQTNFIIKANSYEYWLGCSLRSNLILVHVIYNIPKYISRGHLSWMVGKKVKPSWIFMLGSTHYD